MSRRDEFKNENPNPAQIFLEWKGEKKAFQYWDKDKKENVSVELPFKFLFLKAMHTVRGFSNASESGIYSNEVEYIGKQELTVKSFKGGEIASGLWKDIKGRVDSFGGYYTQSIYAMLEDGTLVNINLKGGAVSKWYEFKKDNFQRMQDEWIIVEDVEERKNGAVKYNVPEFKFIVSLTDDEDKKAEQVYSTLKVYIDAYQDSKDIIESTNKDSENPPENQAPIESYEEDLIDGLPF